jgi:hypothetical protein
MSLSFELLRADDLLAVSVDTVNLTLDASNPAKPMLVRVTAGQEAYLIYEFQPLSIIEKAYFESQGSAAPLDPAGSVPSRMGGGSRLVFLWPATLTQLPFNLSSLLDWSPFQLVLSPVALGTAEPPPIVPPTSLQTALELPYRVLLSPAQPVGWLHARTPVTSAGRTELWHSRIAGIRQVKTSKGTTTRLTEASDAAPIDVRAIWSPDFVDHGVLPDPNEQQPFQAAMTPRNRAELVILTSGVSGYTVPQPNGANIPWVPLPVKASRLFLSTLGGWLTCRGQWPQQPTYTPTTSLIGRVIDPRLAATLAANNAPTRSARRIANLANPGRVTTPALGVIDPRLPIIIHPEPPPPQFVLMSEWDHLATQARDHYVKIVTEGLLYPFGHRAALVTVSERKVVPPDGGVVIYPVAYLRQHQYIIVREKQKSYPVAQYPYLGREMPFAASVTIETKVTPDIDQATTDSFWIDVGGVGYPFHLTAVDLAGAKIDFLAQLMFVSKAETDLPGVQSQYAGSGDLRMCPVHGKRITFADPNAGDTALRTTALYFTSYLVPGATFAGLPFLPTFDSAEITVPVLEELQGPAAAPTSVRAYTGYLQNGLDPNAGVYVQLDTPQSVSFSADKAGGFATPALSLTALSARKGLVAGDPDDAAAGLIRPLDFFSDLSATLFGEVPLSALIAVNSAGTTEADPNAPEIRIQFKPNPQAPTSAITKLTWSPVVTSYQPPKAAVWVTVNEPTGTVSSLTLSTTLTRSLTGGTPQSQIKGELTNFTVSLFGVVGIAFNSLSFSSQSGQKLSVKADLPKSPTPIQFMGALAFLQKLSEILPPGLFGAKGPSLSILSDRLRLSYTLGLPPLTVGVFALDHIAITTGLDLPYLSGRPAFEFAFASRSSPFLILVECLGGGGFVHLVIDASGVEMVEGAIEFGGEFSLDLGVASGGVHILAGIYFQLTDTSTTLTGFLDVGGEVSVLGIISISLDLNLSFTYKKTGNKSVITGKATLTIAIRILFFSMSVSITMEKSFGNTAGDPSIADVITLADWQDYAAAFA